MAKKVYIQQKDKVIDSAKYIINIYDELLNNKDTLREDQPFLNKLKVLSFKSDDIDEENERLNELSKEKEFLQNVRDILKSQLENLEQRNKKIDPTNEEKILQELSLVIEDLSRFVHYIDESTTLDFGISQYPTTPAQMVQGCQLTCNNTNFPEDPLWSSVCDPLSKRNNCRIASFTTISNIAKGSGRKISPFKEATHDKASEKDNFGIFNDKAIYSTLFEQISKQIHGSLDIPTDFYPFFESHKKLHDFTIDYTKIDGRKNPEPTEKWLTDKMLDFEFKEILNQESGKSRQYAIDLMNGLYFWKNGTKKPIKDAIPVPAQVSEVKKALDEICAFSSSNPSKKYLCKEFTNAGKIGNTIRLPAFKFPKLEDIEKRKKLIGSSRKERNKATQEELTYNREWVDMLKSVFNAQCNEKACFPDYKTTNLTKTFLSLKPIDYASIPLEEIKKIEKGISYSDELAALNLVFDTRIRARKPLLPVRISQVNRQTREENLQLFQQECDNACKVNISPFTKYACDSRNPTQCRIDVSNKNTKNDIAKLQKEFIDKNLIMCGNNNNTTLCQVNVKGYTNVSQLNELANDFKKFFQENYYDITDTSEEILNDMVKKEVFAHEYMNDRASFETKIVLDTLEENNYILCNSDNTRCIFTKNGSDALDIVLGREDTLASQQKLKKLQFDLQNNGVTPLTPSGTVFTNLRLDKDLETEEDRKKFLYKNIILMEGITSVIPEKLDTLKKEMNRWCKSPEAVPKNLKNAYDDICISISFERISDYKGNLNFARTLDFPNQYKGLYTGIIQNLQDLGAIECKNNACIAQKGAYGRKGKYDAIIDNITKNMNIKVQKITTE